MSNQIKHIVALRKLSVSSIESLHQQKIQITDSDFVSIRYLNTIDLHTELEQSTVPLIFTSVHGVRATMEVIKKTKRPSFTRSCYAIAGKTSQEAQKEGFTVCATASYGEEIAQAIIKNREKSVLHCTSEMRRFEIENTLSKASISYTPLHIYQKDFTPITLAQTYNAIICFSPSQIESFLTKNELHPATPVFCIGETTANHLRNRQHLAIIVSSGTSEESMVNTILNYYQHN
jgi:uroporphyrinogen-III synthase